MTVEINSPARSSLATRFHDLRGLVAPYVDVLWMVALALIAMEYALHYDLFMQPIPHDTTFHIYAAQQMLIGHPIYRDVAIVKAPLSDIVTAFAIIVARLSGISDIMGARFMSLLVAIGTTAVTYLAGRVIFKSRAVGVIAGLVMAGWDFYGWRALTGPEPKAFLILFGLLALVCIEQRRWFLAGVCSALTALAWQPGLMVTAFALAVAFLEPILARSSHSSSVIRHPSLVVLAGFLVPFALLIIYLGTNDALVAAWNATVGANWFHLTSTDARIPFTQLVADNWSLILVTGGQYCFSPLEDWLVLSGGLGFIGIALAQLWAWIPYRRDGTAARLSPSPDPSLAPSQPTPPRRLQYAPFLFYGLGFAAFSLVDFNFCPDLFPLLPVLALGTGWLAWSAARAVAALAARLFPALPARLFETLAVVLIAAVVSWVYLFDVRAYRLTGTTFQDQENVVQVARKYLAPGDRVLSFGNTIVPIELHLTSASKILHLGSKSGLGVLASEPGGVQGMIAALDSNPPKLITLARESKPAWTAPFYEWLDQRYVPAEVFPRANIRFFVFKQ